MPTYAYEAMNASGQEVKEEIDAESSEAAIAKIRGKGYFPTKVREKAGKKGARSRIIEQLGSSLVARPEVEQVRSVGFHPSCLR